MKSPVRRARHGTPYVLAGVFVVSGGVDAQNPVAPPPHFVSCAPLVCSTQSERFNEQVCVAESDWIVEGEVLYVQAIRADGDRLTIEGMIVKRRSNIKGDYLRGDDLLYIPNTGCATAIQPEWKNRQVRIYGRRPENNPRQIVPLYHHIEVLAPRDAPEPELLSYPRPISP